MEITIENAKGLSIKCDGKCIEVTQAHNLKIRIIDGKINILPSSLASTNNSDKVSNIHQKKNRYFNAKVNYKYGFIPKTNNIKNVKYVSQKNRLPQIPLDKILAGECQYTNFSGDTCSDVSRSASL